MIFPKKYFLFALSALIVLSSCSHYTRMAKSRNMDAKLEYAIELYKKKQYFKALPLFEELITVYRGTKKAEQTYYYYSYCNYQLADFQTAAFDFDNYAKTFPTSEYAEECAYMHAYCYFDDSPIYSLDQTNTYKAINEFQLFIDQHPDSKRIPDCNKIIDQLRLKLESKDFDNAKLYYHTDEYKAAVTAFDNLLKDYPSTVYREEAMFLKLKCGYQLGVYSYEDKKRERYTAALKAYSEFITVYPSSKFKKEADNIAENCRKRMDKLTAQK